ncbi:bifunctional oligoribonuclease/PAP phosphatase NrnA [Bacteroidales bacterium OttesenSCG-928-B11]|nr:bifunctional oligoribonuclease/PAP phosphatase NrnA [Bacteroidales bacterium OttesenSCG-928-B11]MDL2326582.1 bifunctional oligoribonuclease/PAP phosphatase NrnA [Bacteroidales bacterium OttesenSCG-928-A14]
MKKKDITALQSALASAKKITIVSHYNPDGDAVGSALALFHFLNAKGFEVNVVLPNEFPDFLKWMPASGQIIVAENDKDKAKKVVKEADMLFITDMNAPHRSGKILENAIIKSDAFKVLIDHHLAPDIEVDVMLSTVKTSSSCELVYRLLFDYLKEKNALSLEIATCLYVGIITDTGSLTYSCNDPKTYAILNKLIKKGVDGEDTHRKIYDNYAESRIHLLGLSLQRMRILNEYATAYIYLSSQDLKDNDYKMGDTEGFVNYGLTIKTVQFAAIFIQRGEKVRISFRSKGNFDVNQFARKHFNGGGHRNAAAAYHNDTLENTKAYFESILPQYQKELLKPYQEK